MLVNAANKRRSKHEKKRKEKAAGRKIPRKKLENAREIINNPDHKVWLERNVACEGGLHNYQHACNYFPAYVITDLDILIKSAQTCLLRRDWQNLTKILLMYKPNKSTELALPIFAKYASICLAYTCEPLLELLLKSYNCKDTNDVVLKKWTQFKKTNRQTESTSLE